MKSIQIDDDLYHYIASQTQHIGESASDILRRLVLPESMLGQKQSTDAGAQSPSSSDQVAMPDTNSPLTCDAKSVIDELQAKDLQSIPKMVDKWLLALSVIHKYHSTEFAKVLGMSGRNRTYFAVDKATLLATGSSTNPKNVPGSIYWVITNNNTVKKMTMLKNVAKIVGFSEPEVQQLITIFAPELMD